MLGSFLGPVKSMTSLKFSATSEVNFNQRCGFHSVCESTSIHRTEVICYNYELYKRKIRSRHVIRYYGFIVDQMLEKPSKAFILQKPFNSFADCSQIAFGHNIRPFSRPKRVRITGLQGSRVDGSSEESSERESVILKNPNSNSVKNENADLRNSIPRINRKKLWKRFPGVMETIQGQASRLHSLPKKQSLVYERSSTSLVVNVRDDNDDNELEAALSAIGSTSSVEHCNSILKRLEKSSDDKTLNFFEWMRSNGKLKGNITAFNLVLRVLARNEDWSTAEMLLQEMTSDADYKLNSQVFNTLIYACYKSGLTEWGTKWFRAMLKNEVHPNVATFGMLMNLYQKGRNLAEAEFAFTHMRSCKLHCNAAYSAMITMYTRLGLYKKSEEIISIMEEDKVLPNLENWLVRLNAYSQQGKLEEAELVLKLMQAAGISPNIIAYNTLITGYGKVANMDAAQRLFRNLEKIGLKPDETTYRSLIEGFGRAGSYKEVMWLYRELKQSGFHPNSSNFYTTINLQAKHKDEEGAIQTLKDMRVVGCQYSSILSSLLQAYERAGRMHRVPFILKASFYENVLFDQTSCSILAMAYVQHGLLDDALQVLQDKQWKDPIYEDNLYHLMICSCKESGCHENAIKIFTQMPKSSTNPNLHITCSMIDIYSSLDRFSDAEELYLNLKSSGIVLDMVAYSIVVRMYVKAGSLQDACLVLATMEEQKDIVPDTFLFRDMLRIYQRCGMLEKLAEVYYRMLKSRITWDEAIYNCVINCCGHVLPVDELSRLFNEMLQRGFSANTNTCNVMLYVYGKARLFKKLRKVLWMARKRGLADAITFNTVIAAYGQNKDYRNMKNTFLHMRLAGFPVSLEAYNSMLDAYGKGDRLDAFDGVLQKMRETSCVSDHYTYNIMINIYGSKGWIEEVADVLAELREHGLEPDLWSYNTLIKAYGIAGMVEEAVNVVKEMRAKGIDPDRVTYINLISALQKNDNFLEAVKWSLWMKQIGMSSSKC